MIATFPEALHVEVFDAYFERMQNIMKRGPIAFIVDIRELTLNGFEPPVRQEFFRRVKERNTSPGVHDKLCECFVVSSADAQKLLATYFWQVQPQTELRVMTSLEEARAWSLENLAANHALESA